MKKVAVVGLGRTGLIYASREMHEAIDAALMEEVRLDGIHASAVFVDDVIEVKVITPAPEPLHNHKRKPSRY